jgi:Secretion system C-terminal sorting domain
MKTIFSIFIIIIFSSLTYSQNASTFFPANTGYKWFYKNTPLDSANNPEPAGATYQVDSFAAVQNYQGLLASLVLSKAGLSSINQNAPFLDTNYYNFQTTNGWSYLSLIGIIDTAVLPGIGGFLRSFDGWYNVYRFGQAVNSTYTIFSRDTTFALDTLVLPLRFAATGKRLADQTVPTVNGDYLAKKFLTTLTISYGILPPFVYIPIITEPDTTYIAQDVWIIKDILPSVNVDLTSLGFPIAFTIPGTLKELAQGPTGIINYSNSVTDNFKLYQNYPNPFNPNTIINYELGITNFVSLKVFNAEGKEVATLVNQKQNAGSYEVEFNGENFSSGIYFYKLEAGNFFIETKRMILLK